MSQTPLEPRSGKEALFMAMPVLLAICLLTSFGLLVFLVWIGGNASGERVQLAFSGKCLPEARPFLEKRVVGLGLGEPQFELKSEQLFLTATLPDLEGAVQEVPALLSSQGLLTVLDAEKNVLADHQALKSLSLSLNEGGMPYVSAIFDRESLMQMKRYVELNPEKHIAFLVDGEVKVIRPNSVQINVEGEVRIIPEEGDARQRMKDAADMGIMLSHGPYPCTLNVVAVGSKP